MPNFDFQDEDVNDLLNNKQRHLLSYEMGMGKTIVSIKYIYAKFGGQLNQKYILLIAPKFLKDYWKKRINEFLPYGTKYKFKSVKNLDEPAIYFVNYAMLKKYEDLLMRKWDLVLIDEANYIKNKNTIRFKVIDRIYKSGFIDDIILITGTPIQNDISEIWTLIHLLGYPLSYWKFIEKYARTIKIPWVKIIGIKNEASLRELLDQYMIRRLRHKTFKQLPSKIKIKVTMKMLKKQKELYEETKNIFRQKFLPILKLNDGNSVKITNMLTQLVKLRQIADWAGLVDPSITLEEGSNKYYYLKRFIDKMGVNGIIVFTQFKPFAKIISERLGLKLLTGDTPFEERTEVFKKLNDNEIGVVATTQSVTYGIDLPNIRYEIFLDRLYNPKKQEQAEDRGYRITRLNDLEIFEFVSEKTIDELVYKKSLRKEEIIKRALDIR